MEVIIKFSPSLLNKNNIQGRNHNIIENSLGVRLIYKENDRYYISYIFDENYSLENLKNNTINNFDNIDLQLLNYYYGCLYGYHSDLNEVKNTKKYILNNASYGLERTDVLTKDEYFMTLAIITSCRSKDPSTQVGACIVSDKGRILSVGYNGTPNGYPDSEFPWAREGSTITTKYAFVCHAELNAIMNFDGDKKDFLGSTLYVDLFPCNNCAKAIIQSGIKKIVYLSDKYENTDETIISKHLFDKCGVSFEQISYDKDVITNKILKLKR